MSIKSILSSMVAATLGLMAMACTTGLGSQPPVPQAEVPQDGVVLGIFIEGAQTDLAKVHAVERQIGKRFSSVMWYQDWSTPFPAADAERVSRGGYLPHITWEAWFFADKEKVKLDDILAGAWDSYISAYAQAVASFDRPLMIRWGHECNGDWYPWSLAANGKSADTYIQAWRHIHGLFQRAGASKVLWVWSPNAASVPNEAWNALTAAYPGDDYVDWVAIDGYNFSGGDSFKTIFGAAYTKLLTSIRRPVMIGEFATGGAGEDKAAWLRQMSDDIASLFPGLKAMVWFEINKELDWRLMASETTAKAAREAFAPDFFVIGANQFDSLSDYFYGSYAYLAEQTALLKPAVIVRETIARHAATAPVVDGQTGDWSGEPSIALTGAGGPTNLGAQVRLSWDAANLYVLAEVSDDVPLVNRQAGADIWNGDNLELCLSLDPAAEPAREFFGPADFQIGLSPGDAAGKTVAASWEWSKLKGPIPGLGLAVVSRADGWIMEAAIPWAALAAAGQEITPQAGLKLGFDLAIDDADAKATRESQTIWNGDSSFYANPAQWGRIQLGD